MDAEIKGIDLKGQGEVKQHFQIPDVVPVLPLRDLVTFPYMIVPLLISSKRAIKVLEKVMAQDRILFLATQRDPSIENPSSGDVYDIGSVGLVIRKMKAPDGRIRVLLQGMARARVERWEDDPPNFQAELAILEETAPKLSKVQMEALVRRVHGALEKASALGKSISQEMIIIANNLEDPGRLADLIASNLNLKVEEGQELLAILDPAQRLSRIYDILAREIDLLTVQRKIDSKARDEIDKVQREYFLRQQLKAIQTELGEGASLNEEAEQYLRKAEEIKITAGAKEEFDRQVRRLERLQPDSVEAATMRSYLDCMVSLPWNIQTRDNRDLHKARKILENDHYGLETVKARMVEHLAVRKLKQDSKGPILCLVGPPGTGKTSLGRSIARALGRKFTRVSLGGVHDEAEIRGHRRTYVGSMPGRIIQGLQQAGSSNPVFMMDEIDKVSSDFRGDPSSALLEVLDPEQNNTFRDNYLGVPYDLSNVLFITTANMLDTIHPAVRDRMEIIQVTGYTEEDKVEIARRHVIPQQIANHGLKPGSIHFPDAAIREIISGYTREAGLRNLEREIASVCRKIATRVSLGAAKPVTIDLRKIRKFLGQRRFTSDEALTMDQVGIATGLAWTPVGGEILFVEAQAMVGKGGLLLTGQMGSVMRESAQAALSYARAHASEYGIDENFFSAHDLHIHMPEGSIPKDGPSAGVTLASALVSACTGRPVRRDLAMTGEITLRGEILPVGGIKEKFLAARRGQISIILLPRENAKDLDELPKQLRKDLKIILVDKLNEVLRHALVREPK
jgi:ATP-dependent Lon protease